MEEDRRAALRAPWTICSLGLGFAILSDTPGSSEQFPETYCGFSFEVRF
jgi:hypothetical protein